ncbi:hypothetical protein [Holospora curviuscula]|uniref:Uncharacterized protein n=1 Tax=Holospora curviuscula TaxID=1082868 RepID=A0A2S5RA70_9PROT|nr:hypothetical protein [Holospora curviuscula]PPE04208.1 hypothetical protein HCUR_00399 [Holospora curviuscula]
MTRTYYVFPLITMILSGLECAKATPQQEISDEEMARSSENSQNVLLDAIDSLVQDMEKIIASKDAERDALEKTLHQEEAYIKEMSGWLNELIQDAEHCLHYEKTIKAQKDLNTTQAQELQALRNSLTTLQHSTPQDTQAQETHRLREALSALQAKNYQQAQELNALHTQKNIPSDIEKVESLQQEVTALKDQNNQQAQELQALRNSLTTLQHSTPQDTQAQETHRLREALSALQAENQQKAQELSTLHTQNNIPSDIEKVESLQQEVTALKDRNSRQAQELNALHTQNNMPSDIEKVESLQQEITALKNQNSRQAQEARTLFSQCSQRNAFLEQQATSCPELLQKDLKRFQQMNYQNQTLKMKVREYWDFIQKQFPGFKYSPKTTGSFEQQFQAWKQKQATNSSVTTPSSVPEFVRVGSPQTFALGQNPSYAKNI